MNHLHTNRAPVSELSMIKQAVQYTFFLVVCIWLLYQIHHSLYVRRDSDCDFIGNKFTDERIAEVLGQRGGLKGGKLGHYTEEVDSYGVDLIGEVGNTGNVTEGEYDQSDKSDSEGNGEIRSFENQINEILDNSLMLQKSGNDQGKDIKTEVNDSILRIDEKVEIFRFSDENGIPEHESEISEITKLGKVSNGRNQTEECLNVCSQKATETVPKQKEMPKRGSTRDILLSEK